MTAAEVLIYLAACVVNGTPPDPAAAASVDEDELLAMASVHQLSAIAAEGLKRAGRVDGRVAQTLYDAARIGAHVVDSVAVRRQREASAPRAGGVGGEFALQRGDAVRAREVEDLERHRTPRAGREPLRGQLRLGDRPDREEVVRRAARHRLKGRLGGCRAHQARHRDDK
jgi:hypothetical protein